MTKLATTTCTACGLSMSSRDRAARPSASPFGSFDALVDCQKVTTDMDSGDVEPTARIRRIEVIREDKDRAAMMLRRSLEVRTGKTVLPFDLEEDMRAAFEGIDPSTGEILG